MKAKKLSKRIASKKPTKADLMQLRTEIAQAAQKIYDEWEQDEEGSDEELGSGGICDQIAEAIAGVLSDHGYDTEEGGHDGDDHAYVVVPLSDSHGFAVDIPWDVYESKLGMYEYRKKPGVKFGPNHVFIDEY